MNPFELFNLKAAPFLLDKNAGAPQQSEELSAKSLKSRYTRMQAACHPDSFAMASDAQQKAAAQMSSRLNQAYRMLVDDLQRVKAWLHLNGLEIENQTTQPDMALFELQMSLEERFEALRNGKADDIHASIENDLQQLRQQALDWFKQVFNEKNRQPDAASNYILNHKDQCLNYYGRLALATRLDQRLRSPV